MSPLVCPNARHNRERFLPWIARVQYAAYTRTVEVHMACGGMDVDGVGARAGPIYRAMHRGELRRPDATVELPCRQPECTNSHYVLLHERTNILEHSTECDRQPISNHSDRTAKRRDYCLPTNLLRAIQRPVGTERDLASRRLAGLGW